MCLELGIDDPEAWLDSQPERVVRLWAAYWRVEPWGLPWHRHAAWQTMLDAMYAMCLRWFSGGKSKYKPRKFADWMPVDWVSDEQPNKADKNELIEQLDRLAGLKR